MNALIRYKTCWFVFAMICLSACAPEAPGQAVTIVPTRYLATIEVTKPTAIATVTPRPTDTVTPVSATPVTTENTATPTTTPVVTNTAHPITEMLIDECPEMINANGKTLWSGGSILFGTGLLVNNHYVDADSFQPQESGIWAISAHQLEPQLAYAVPDSSNSWASLSGDGNTLLHIVNDSFYLTGEAREAVFYDLRSQTEVRIVDGPRIVWNYEWLADGRVKLLVNEERMWGVGTRREYLVIDPEIRQSETSVEEIALPGYQFNDEPSSHGYASVSPSGEFALYSATADSGVDIRLLNLITGEILWQQNAEALPGPYQPEWKKDSSHVLFYLDDLIEDEVYVKIVRLGSDGRLKELPQQPYPELYPSTSVWLLTSSPDQRYIIYRVGGREPAGYVIDTTTSQIREICEPEAIFIDGQWITNDLFVYRASMEKDGLWAHSLRVLDVPAWTTQAIFETEPGYGINIVGWTPVEFSKYQP